MYRLLDSPVLLTSVAVTEVSSMRVASVSKGGSLLVNRRKLVYLSKNIHSSSSNVALESRRETIPSILWFLC